MYNYTSFQNKFNFKSIIKRRHILISSTRIKVQASFLSSSSFRSGIKVTNGTTYRREIHHFFISLSNSSSITFDFYFQYISVITYLKIKCMFTRADSRVFMYTSLIVTFFHPTSPVPSIAQFYARNNDATVPSVSTTKINNS